MNLEHPIVFNHYNMCEMARQKELKNLKLGLLQTLCNKSDLEGSIVRRPKAKSLLRRCSD